ncbi:MAG: fatty acid oxidation complex subunit alpha FadJ [Flavobacteriales bacterium]|nr:fatty acid oxidation complex subunit alpha FadJ [Flavobacteriales bacterium]
MKNKYVEIEKRDGIAIIWMDEQDSKINKIGPDMIETFNPMMDELEKDPEVKAAVMISRKKDFIAGADIEAFANVKKEGDWQPIAKKGHEILNRLQKSKKPVVAAINGACMGAGLEIALACAARVASDSPKTILSLPEVKLGLLPGGGGTQRLPRLVGIQKALDMMLTGKNVFAYPAKKMGLVDRLSTKEALLDAAICLAKELTKGPLKREDKRSGMEKFLEGNPITKGIIFKKAKEMVDGQTKGNYPAPYEILECVRIGMTSGEKRGYEEEVKRFEKLILTPESFQLRGIFFAMTEKKKNPLAELAKPVDTIAMVGAGFMGAGIAQVSAAKDVKVLLKDIKQETITQAKQTIWKDIGKKVQRKAMPQLDADRLMNRIAGQLDYNNFEKVQVVIEAVFEDLKLKHRVLAECEEAMSPNAIFASNTSALPIGEIAKASKRPEQVIGMHYFSPVPKMPLLEIVVTDQTADWVTSTCYDLGVKQGKTVIVVKDGPGFYTTRILAPLLGEALNMLEEGADALQIDKVLKKFGFPVGPITLMDEVGIDVGAHIMSGELMQHFISTRKGAKASDGLKRMFDAGYHGRKNKKGFYQYDENGNKKKELDANVYSFFGGNNRKKFDDKEIYERIGMSMVSEAALCLQEGIVSNPLDGDVGAVFGLGFPPFRGGPFRYMDALGAQETVDIFNRLAQKHGERFLPPQIIVDKAKAGEKFYS